MEIITEFDSPEAIRKAKILLYELNQEKLERIRGRRLFTYYPDVGPLRRELYKKHLAFFKLGAEIGTRGFIAANRIGKTEGAGGYEVVLHLTGRYPEWWEGARFDAPTRVWAAGDTGKSVREIIQEKLLGPFGSFGTGLIPAEDIVRYTSKSGVSEAIDTLWVKHYTPDGVHDGNSRIVFKSYDQKRESFQGTEQDVIWLDEEAPESIRTECVLRLMTTDGLLIETFTPLKGITPVVMQYMPKGEMNSDIQETGVSIVDKDKALVMAGWDDVPHLGEDEKRRMLAETPPFLRDARSKGIPSLGAGAIYPVPESDIKIKDFAIPKHWKRAYALDVGWNRTAALWGAWDDDGVIHIYAEHYKGHAEPVIHAAAIKGRGEWMQGVVDPASRGRSQADGEKLYDSYKSLGLHLTFANNSVEAGLLEVWQMLSTGKLKIFASCQNFFTEYRMYRRDEKGNIVKVNDHLMDALRYLVMSGKKVATVAGQSKAGNRVIQGIGMLDPEIGY